MDRIRVTSDQQSKAFWEFSVDVFTRDGVEENCLLLQDRYGFNVNLTLFCVWVGFSGRPALTATDIAAAVAASAHWHGAVVEPLRNVRRVVQAVGEVGDTLRDLQTLRRSLLHNELTAERIEQAAIVATLSGGEMPALDLDGRLTSALISLSTYVDTTRITLDQTGRKALLTVAHAVFDDVPRNKLSRLANRLFTRPA